jgi:hypothetical protein
MSVASRFFAGLAAWVIFALALCDTSHAVAPSASAARYTALGCVRYNKLALPDYWTLLAMDWEYMDGWVCPPMAMRAPIPQAATWTGVYLGANATHGWAGMETSPPIR